MGAARVLEEAGAVTEQHRRDDDQDLVEHPGLEALACDVGAEHVHVATAGGLLGQVDRRDQVGGEGDVGGRLLRRRRVREHDRGPVPPPAVGALGVGALVGVVAGERAVPDQQRADVGHQRVDVEAGPLVGGRACCPDVRAEPRHVTAGARDETVEGHRRRVQQLAHATSPSTMVHFPLALCPPEGEAMTSTRATRRTRDVDAVRLSRPHRTTLGVAAGLILGEALLELARPAAAAGRRPGAGRARFPLLVRLALRPRRLAARRGGGSHGGAAQPVRCRRQRCLGGPGRRGGGAHRQHAGGDLVARVLDHSPSFFRRHRSAELINRLTSDVRRVEDSVVAWWEIAVPESVVLVGTLVMLAVIDPLLALTALGVCPALAAVIVVRRRLVRRAQGRAREQEGRLSESAQDLVRNVRVVQAFGRQRAVQPTSTGSASAAGAPTSRRSPSRLDSGRSPTWSSPSAARACWCSAPCACSRAR